ncbi:MAG: LptF/LptG family permease [Bacteroidales bacterium]|nr:LptF/LptG family permease [Bacteroidales bacterium]
MFHLKRLYAFILKTFLPLFSMTFGICLFIVLMQFLWRYIDDMVGKGLEISVLAEMLCYAALSLVPLALPLSILLASLMTFGNLGERLELLAMKAAGVSLIRIMRPIIIVICFISIGAFYFQNNVMPVVQVKLYTLLFSMRQKSPELDIPEGSFYSQIEGYNFYVRKKNFDTGMLYGLMIYDHSNGFENASIILADSGNLKTSLDKRFLILKLHSGESFENLTKQQGITNQAVPYRRETFKTKEVFIEFDANFNRIDGSFLQGQYIGKNMKELQYSIDSMNVYLDSIKQENASVLEKYSYLRHATGNRDSIVDKWKENKIDAASLFKNLSAKEKYEVTSIARNTVEMIRNDNNFKASTISDEELRLRRHMTEWHKKFTLSFACIVFFFIGAPLGAIIRKGGIGMPVVISVVLFIFYYIIDNIGFKLAKEGVWDVWEGMWLSSFILFPLGAFLTYKAANDSAVLNIDTYLLAIKEWFGRRSARNIERKSLVLQPLNYTDFFNEIKRFDALCRSYLEEKRHIANYFRFWLNRDFRSGGKERVLIAEMEKIVDMGTISDQNLLLVKLMDYPQISPVRQGVNIAPKMGILLGLIFPLGILVYLYVVNQHRLFVHDLKVSLKVNEELMKIVTDIEKKEDE